MENKMQVFSSQQFGNVRAIMRDGEPWFVAADICKALEIANNRDALTRIDNDEKGVALADTLGGKQEVTIVNEPGLYSLVLGSRKPEAKVFKRWVTHEVIPSIRKHGAYLTPEALERAMTDPDFTIGLLTALKSERESRKIAETKVNLLSAEVLTWADRKVLNAIIRKYSAAVHNSDFAKGWNAFYKELLYKHEINLKTRATQRMNHTGKKVPRLDMLDDSELPAAISTAVAMCCEQGVDIDDILQNVAA